MNFIHNIMEKDKTNLSVLSEDHKLRYDNASYVLPFVAN